MPTARPRHSITETEDVARALDAAARRWPEEEAARSRLLLRLIRAGHRALEDDREAAAARRRERIERTRAALTGAYGEGYLRELRDDWPR